MLADTNVLSVTVKYTFKFFLTVVMCNKGLCWCLPQNTTVQRCPKFFSHKELLCQKYEILCCIPQWCWPSTKAIIFQGDIYAQLLKPCNGSNKEALKGPEAQLPVSTGEEIQAQHAQNAHNHTCTILRSVSTPHNSHEANQPNEMLSQSVHIPSVTRASSHICHVDFGAHRGPAAWGLDGLSRPCGPLWSNRATGRERSRVLTQ